MGMLDDTAIFVAIVQQGGFSHAAKYLNLSNGLISRRLALLEASLGVSLIKRTTRQITLTPEGQIFLQHAQRIQQELDSALVFMQGSANKPTGLINISAPVYFGRHYLTPVIMKFLTEFPGIKINLVLNNNQLDPIKHNIDIIIRGTGYLENRGLKDSTLHVKSLFKEKIKVYASTTYLQKNGEPKKVMELANHTIIGLSNSTGLDELLQWSYRYKNQRESVTVVPSFNTNDIESSLIACSSGYGISRFSDLNIRSLLQQQLVKAILDDYDWGTYELFAAYTHQKVLPKRCRLLLDFLSNHMKSLVDRTEVG